MSQVWTMKLTESINIFYVSDRVARTIKVNIKNPSWETMVSCKCLFVDGLQSENN